MITFKTDYTQSLIDDFSVKDKAPHIAISVDILDTGIDVPEVVNLVLFKIVRSKAKFWQMLGRGTRLCPDLYGPGQHKADFRVFAFCQNLEFFSQHLEGSDGALAQPLGQRLFNTRLALMAALDQHLAVTGEQASDADAGSEIRLTEAGLRRDTANLLQAIVAGMSLDNFVVRPKRQWVQTWSKAEAWARPSGERLLKVGELSEVLLPLGCGAGDFERFRTKVRAFLRAHEDHLALHRLRRNLPLTPADLAELDRQAATEAPGGFLQDKTLGSNQMEFLNLIVNHLTERGVVDAALLYEPPFTGYAAQVAQLFQTLEQIRASALAA